MTCLAVMYARGLRSISEATTLEVGAPSTGPTQVLRIVGKGNKERLVPLPPADPQRTGMPRWRTLSQPPLVVPQSTRRRTGQQAGAVRHLRRRRPDLRGSRAG